MAWREFREFQRHPTEKRPSATPEDRCFFRERCAAHKQGPEAHRPCWHIQPNDTTNRKTNSERAEGYFEHRLRAHVQPEKAARMIPEVFALASLRVDRVTREVEQRFLAVRHHSPVLVQNSLLTNPIARELDTKRSHLLWIKRYITGIR